MVRKMRNVLSRAIYLSRITIGRRRYPWLARIYSRAAYSAVFSHRSVVWVTRGYWQLEPMPKADELERFYARVYWASIPDHGPQAPSQRETILIDLALRHFPELLDGGLTIVHLGPGRSTVSRTLAGFGNTVIDVEPGDAAHPSATHRGSRPFPGVISREIRLGDIESEVDLFFSSHSLEHVADVTAVERWWQTHLRPRGGLIVEVPNCEVPGNGGSDGSIAVPHTYYFTRAYFEQLPFSTILCAAFSESTSAFSEERPDGNVIRFVGRISSR